MNLEQNLSFEFGTSEKLGPYHAEFPVSGFTFIDLFAGIGGLRLAMEGAGGVCRFTSEWDKFASETYNFNFRDNHPISGNIQEVNPEEIPNHDVLVAGFPCQPFSLAGVSKKNSLGRAHGFDDEKQGNLFFNIVEILEVKKPQALLLENVKNLKGHDKGRTFKVIRDYLESLGYTISTRIIDAAHYVPQHRERIIIVGLRNGKKFDFDRVHLPKYGQNKMGSILHREDGRVGKSTEKYLDENGKVLAKYTLSDKLWKYLQDYAAKHKAKGNGFGYGLVNRNSISRTLSARYHKDGSEILVDQGVGNNPRRLTPRECARLMGFPEDFEIPVSDTQAYRQFGNSVAVPVFEAVAAELVKYIE